MKQLYFFPLFLLLANAAFSQQKFEFGFAVKVGSFTLPSKEKTENTYGTKIYPAGSSASFGAFTSMWLGKRFGISAEVLYGFSAYHEQNRYSYRNLDRYSWSNTDRQFEVHSLMLPLKIHFSLKKNRRFSLTAGLVPSFILSSNVLTTFENDSGYQYVTKGEDLVTRMDGGDGIQLFLTAGGHYQLNDYTSVGLEFTGTFGRNSTESYPGYINFCGFGYEETYPFQMKSLAISLHHNILR